MTKMKFTTAAVGTAILLLTASAKADIRVTLSSGASSETESSTGTLNPNQFSGFFSVGDYAITIQTAFSNPPASNGGIGVLSATSIVGYTTGSGTLANLMVTVQDVDSSGNLVSFGSPSPSSYDVTNSANVNIAQSTTLSLNGSAQINAANLNVAPVSVNLMNSVTGTASSDQVISNVSGYNLAQSYTLSGMSGGTSNLVVGFNTSVAPTSSPAAVPEPSSLVLTGLAAIILGVVVLRRHLRGHLI